MARTARPLPDERPEVDRRAARDEDEAYAAASAGAPTRRRGPDRSWSASLGATGYLLLVTGAALVIVLVVAAAAVGGWLVLAVAVAVLVAALAGIGSFLISRTREIEKPSAEEVADLEAQGVRDPEGELNERLEHEHQEHVTPSGVDSDPVGPGRGT
jgi:hypothetical protein